MIYFSRDEVERIGRAGAFQLVDEDGSIAYRYLSSFWLYVEPDDIAFTPHGMTGYWESWVTKWISKHLDWADCFIDVGANVGYYSMLAGKHGVDTYAVEPLPHLQRMLVKTRELNRLTHNVYLISDALSDYEHTGVGYINYVEQHSGGSYLDDEGIQVTVSTVDNSFPLVSGKKVLMKIDAEGQEPNIIKGMTEFIKRNNVTIVLEWQAQRWQDAGDFVDDLIETFGELAIVNYMGGETPVDRDYLVNSTDLEMVVVRSAAV
jgi:FkbM family methyltransferase